MSTTTTSKFHGILLTLENKTQFVQEEINLPIMYKEPYKVEMTCTYSIMEGSNAFIIGAACIFNFTNHTLYKIELPF